MVKKVTLDAGHNALGNPDTGASGNGLYEQDLTLVLVRKIKPKLEFNGIAVQLTRDGDRVPGSFTDVTGSLQARCTISNNFQSDIFVSVHINAGGGTGTEVLIYEAGGQAEVLAKKVIPYLVQAGQWANRGVKVAHDYVTGPNTEAPAILTENGFIDTLADATKLKSDAFLEGLATAHAKGICDYFGINYKEKGAVDVLDVAILKFSSEDDWSAKDVDAKLGGVANFTRQGATKVIPKDAMSAKKLIVIGGATTGHPNEVLLSGKTKFDTADAVGKYLG